MTLNRFEISRQRYGRYQARLVVCAFAIFATALMIGAFAGTGVPANVTATLGVSPASNAAPVATNYVVSSPTAAPGYSNGNLAYLESPPPTHEDQSSTVEPLAGGGGSGGC